MFMVRKSLQYVLRTVSLLDLFNLLFMMDAAPLLYRAINTENKWTCKKEKWFARDIH